MIAIQITAQYQVQVLDIPAPVLKPGHVLLKIGYVGFCGSDLNTFRGLNPLSGLPVIPGHEIGAIISEVADDVPEHLQVGMHATVNPYTSCGLCPACENGRANACEFNQTMGVQRDGAMAEYVLVPWQKVIADDRISVRDLALVEPMSVGFHAADRAHVSDNDTVLVIGCGMIGIGAIVRAVRRGANVIVTDISDKKLELATRLGARYTINSAVDNLHDRIMDITAGRGADVVIEAVGRRETYIASITEAAFTARVVYIGYAKEPIPFDTQYFVKKELDIRGSRNALPKDFKAVMEYLKKGICPVEDLISATVSPENAQKELMDWDAHPGDVFRILVRF